MKVLVFTSLYPNNVWPNHGVFVKERMTQFAMVNGCDVRVIAPVPYFPRLKINNKWGYSQVSKREIIEGLPVYHPRYFMIPKVGMAIQGLFMFLFVVLRVREVQRDFNFDVIDAHYLYPDGFVAVLLGRVLRKPVVVSARGSDINLFKDFRIIRRILQFTLLKADRVIAVSHALKEAIIGLNIPREKISVIPNGVDSRKFYPLTKKEARMKLGLPDKKIILSVGKLTPNKGFELLIKAIRILKEKYHRRDIYLCIVGDGGMQDELKKIKSSNGLDADIYLVGGVPHQELVYWYNAADLFCLASGREGWPNVVLESLACGKPVVATAVGGIPEIITSDRVGLLSERKEEDIADKIQCALKKNWSAEEIVNHAKKHTWDKTAISVLEVLQSTLNNKNAK